MRARLISVHVPTMRTPRPTRRNANSIACLISAQLVPRIRDELLSRLKPSWTLCTSIHVPT